MKERKAKRVARITALLCAALCVFCAACGLPHEEAETLTPAGTPAVSLKPDTYVFAFSDDGEGKEKTEAPLPTVTPVPEPTLEPTPEPDPYLAGVEAVTVREGFVYAPLNDAMKARITGLSYPADPADCRVPYEDLRYLQLLYTDFDGNDCRGEMVVNRVLAEEVLEIFMALYDARYPLASVRLVDDFGEVADDNLSMAADNTSSFCYRKVTGSKKLSRHSYGAAIDINPVENPYIRPDGSVAPEAGKAYTDRRKDFAHKIDKSDLCYRLFTERGWEWGGDFRSEKDYQHFSKDIGY